MCLWHTHAERDMAAIHTWAFLLLWIGTSAQDSTPDVHVTCVFSGECVLPCIFPPAGNEVVSWYRQEAVVYSFPRGVAGGERGEGPESEQYAGRASVAARLVSHGNASLHLRGCGTRDRGRYRCHVRTAAGVHEAHVIVKVEAPIQSVTLELSRLSGYEEMKCVTRDVYPAPHVTWATDPPTSKALKPITRKVADRQTGLYAVESRLRRLKDQSELAYICQVNSSYGTQVWTASLREREIRGIEGSDLTIPCHAPPYLRNPSLTWTFAIHNEPAPILTYDGQSQRSSASAPWEGRARLDPLRVPSGDGSLRLVDPDSLEHTGIYMCVYSSPRNTHTEHTNVDISAGQGTQLADRSHWWIVAVVIAVLCLTLVGILIYLKRRGSQSQPTKPVEDDTEMQPVGDILAKTDLCEDSPLTSDDANG